MTLMEAQAIVESSNDPLAIRFEPGLYTASPGWIARILPLVRSLNSCSTDTAKMIACTSFGMYQLLGANIYSLGYAHEIMAYGDDILQQHRDYSDFMGRGGFSAYTDMDVTAIAMPELLAIARYYNGPGNPQAYADALLKVENKT